MAQSLLFIETFVGTPLTLHRHLTWRGKQRGSGLGGQRTNKESKERDRGLGRESIKREQPEALIRDQDKSAPALFEEAPMAYFTIGTDRAIKDCNHMAQELLAYSKEELIGKDIVELMADSQRKKGEAVWERLLSGNGIVQKPFGLEELSQKLRRDLGQEIARPRRRFCSCISYNWMCCPGMWMGPDLRAAFNPETG